jgi:peptide-methionine (S)-S-oxide reductase
MDGVIRTTVGYAGGSTPGPTYRRIGDHTETLEIEFDPAVVSYEELLDVFWQAHDPLRPAWSRQYRSAIFCHDDEQCRLAEASRDRARERRGREIHTAIEPVGPFTRAEDYHQKYRLRGDRELLAEFAEMYPDPHEFTDSTAAARVNGLLAGDGGPEALERDGERLGLSDDGLARLRSIVEGLAAGTFGRIFRCS